jgi:hypothetical protein
MKTAVEFQWTEVGEVRLGDDGKLAFPRLLFKPGVYAFRFAGHEPATMYIGETDNLQRRVAHYRNPGPTQSTHIRLNQRIRNHLANQGRIAMDVILTARIQIDLATDELNLASVRGRRMLENVALVAAERVGEKVENL